MSYVKENPRYNVISLRISDKERAALDDFARQSHRSVSELMREAMGLMQGQMRRPETS